MSDRRSSKRSAAARVRRNEEKRARQRQSWREAEHVRSSLTNLEDKAENWRSQWESDQAKGLTDGSSIDGRHCRALNRVVLIGAVLNAISIFSLISSSLRPLLLSKLAAVFNPNFPEDWQIIEDVDRGHPITLFEKDSFRNYKSAETEEGRRIVADCLGKEIEKGYLVKETDTDHLPADAIVSEAVPMMPSRRAAISRIRLPFLAFGRWLCWRHTLWNASDAVDDDGNRQLFKNLRLVFGLVSSPVLWIRTYNDGVFESAAYRVCDDLVGLLLISTAVGGRLHLEVEIPPEKVVMICQQGDHILEQYNTKHKVAIKDVESFLALYSWCHKLKSVAGANGKPLHSAYLGRKAAEKINLLLEDILGVRLSGTQHMIVITDASLAGFAGTMLIGSQRYWFCELESGHISTLELLAAIVAVLASVRSCGIDRTEADFTVLSDNISTVEALNKGTSGSQRMADLLARFSAMGMNHRSIRAFHLPGNENVISDSLSRDGVPRPAIARVIGERVDILPVLQEILRTDPLKAPICLM